MGLAVLVASLSLAACTKNGEAFESFQRVNAERSGQGLPGLQLDDALVAKAQAWAETLAATGSVRHSGLTDGAPADWQFLAENVGSATSVAEMHGLFMGSPHHRDNILDGRPTRIGTGAAMAGGRVYVVQEFAA